ncbi:MULTISPECIES: LacI family DNA-binding transcriptional regulator [Latilactobacillus]|uniref:LacI family DNA-binding transcriptional regulator n=1 Tax=Latilactobacillus TaxID=2767885 RepID=UPI0020A52B95|nr:LacI family DNA-binding transcriptional regulator [Latilactobacillus curvatus]UTC12401.1 hypothetical protein A4W75_04695 [Latilactobacillus curvatus]
MAIRVLTPDKLSKHLRNEKVVLHDYKTMQDIADYFKVSKATVSRWARLEKNPLPSYRPPFEEGKVVLFILSECEAWYRGGFK